MSSARPISLRPLDLSEYVLVDSAPEDERLVKFIRFCSISERDEKLKWDRVKKKMVYDGIPVKSEMLDRLKQIAKKDGEYSAQDISLCRKVARLLALRSDMNFDSFSRDTSSSATNQKPVQKIAEWMRSRLDLAGEVIKNKDKYPRHSLLFEPQRKEERLTEKYVRICFPSLDSEVLDRKQIEAAIAQGNLFIGQQIYLDNRWEILSSKLIDKIDGMAQYQRKSTCGEFRRQIEQGYEETCSLEEWLKDDVTTSASDAAAEREYSGYLDDDTSKSSLDGSFVESCSNLNSLALGVTSYFHAEERCLEEWLKEDEPATSSSSAAAAGRESPVSVSSSVASSDSNSFIFIEGG